MLKKSSLQRLLSHLHCKTNDTSRNHVCRVIHVTASSWFVNHSRFYYLQVLRTKWCEYFVSNQVLLCTSVRLRPSLQPPVRFQSHPSTRTAIRSTSSEHSSQTDNQHLLVQRRYLRNDSRALVLCSSL
jgi:hypothetical protein